MTVCIAAIASTGLIIVASDRMLSTSEIAYEPENRKIVQFTTAIAGLWAGDAAVQAEVISAVRRDIAALIAQDPPPDWFKAEEVVQLYVAHWNAVKRRRATAALLAPLGLGMNDFLHRQQNMDSGVVDRLSNAIISYALPPTAIIIAGIDHEGPHIWTIHDGVAFCADQVGFAAIGAGERHASSQMMQGRHSRAKTPSETLVLVHLAKKRAEAAPSVGAATDIILIGPQLGQEGPLGEEHMDALDRHYDALAERERSALASAVAGFDAFLASRAPMTDATQEVDDEEAPGGKGD